jgi:hypothetical protein
VAVPFPTNAEDFCTVYDAMRRSERPVEDGRILRLHFEDLIYRYDDSCAWIYDFLDVSPSQHARLKGTQFKPQVSIHNTQLFRQDKYPADEIRIIEKRLERYLYPFPADVPAPTSSDTIF